LVGYNQIDGENEGLEGKGCLIVSVACAYSWSGDGGMFIDMAVKRIASRNVFRTPVFSVLR
jgi:hypothetical protein